MLISNARRNEKTYYIKPTSCLSEFRGSCLSFYYYFFSLLVATSRTGNLWNYRRSSGPFRNCGFSLSRNEVANAKCRTSPCLQIRLRQPEIELAASSQFWDDRHRGAYFLTV